MISSSGVVWDQENNYVHATTEQWKAWREVYPMSRAYTFHGDPLFAELKTLFGPEENDDGEGLILIIDSEDEDQHDSDSDDIYDMFDSEVEINFITDEEMDVVEQSMHESVVEVIDGFMSSDDEVTTPECVPIPSETHFFFDDAFVSRDSYYLRDGFTTSDSESD
ncbi:hypothetical protein ACS0TY_004475 [Phlomoides rotata]